MVLWIGMSTAGPDGASGLTEQFLPATESD